MHSTLHLSFSPSFRYDPLTGNERRKRAASTKCSTLRPSSPSPGPPVPFKSLRPASYGARETDNGKRNSDWTDKTGGGSRYGTVIVPPAMPSFSLCLGVSSRIAGSIIPGVNRLAREIGRCVISRTVTLAFRFNPRARFVLNLLLYMLEDTEVDYSVCLIFDRFFECIEHGVLDQLRQRIYVSS